MFLCFARFWGRQLEFLHYSWQRPWLIHNIFCHDSGFVNYRIFDFSATVCLSVCKLTVVIVVVGASVRESTESRPTSVQKSATWNIFDNSSSPPRVLVRKLIGMCWRCSKMWFELSAHFTRTEQSRDIIGLFPLQLCPTKCVLEARNVAIFFQFARNGPRVFDRPLSAECCSDRLGQPSSLSFPRQWRPDVGILLHNL